MLRSVDGASNDGEIIDLKAKLQEADEKFKEANDQFKV